MFKDVNLIKYDRYYTYIKEFKDLEDFLSNIIDEEINPIFKYDIASKTEDFFFSKTKSYQEAWNLCRFTMNKGFENFQKKFNRINYDIDYFAKKMDCYSVVGYTPSVPRYLLGIPCTMHSYAEEKTEKTINIYMNIAYTSKEKYNAIENRGILVLNLIDYLEKIGYKVNFNTFDITKTRKEMMFINIPLKNWYEKSNLKKMYFPLVHPSFLRRLGFRAMEKMPVRDYEWNDGYGFPVEYKETSKFLEYYQEVFEKDKIIYISTPSEMGITGNDLQTDFDNFIKIINKKYKLIESNEEKRKVR